MSLDNYYMRPANSYVEAQALIEDECLNLEFTMKSIREIVSNGGYSECEGSMDVY